MIEQYDPGIFHSVIVSVGIIAGYYFLYRYRERIINYNQTFSLLVIGVWSFVFAAYMCFLIPHRFNTEYIKFILLLKNNRQSPDYRTYLSVSYISIVVWIGWVSIVTVKKITKIKHRTRSFT